MFQYFCWFEIREAVAEEDESRQSLSAALDSIRSWLSESQFSNLDTDRNMRLGLTSVNGIPILLGFGSRNRHINELNELNELLSIIAEKAPGSYGMLYTLDEFDRSLPPLTWRVFVLKRGTVTEQLDPFFSPMIPAVEDGS